MTSASPAPSPAPLLLSPTDAAADTHRPYNYDSLMHYGTGSGAIVTPADQTIRIGRRTGGFDGNDASQIRQIYSCAVSFGGNPSAVRPGPTLPLQKALVHPFLYAPFSTPWPCLNIYSLHICMASSRSGAMCPLSVESGAPRTSLHTFPTLSPEEKK